ncbi:ABC transporter permease [Haloechinothrix salitolerans]|uniref:ABC transporter permease n=1 Tax=Haloechinothrix salitolerans TaxID=926830 RepID=A0ABW2C596_9PSEU
MWTIVLSGLVTGGLYLAISLGVVVTIRFAHAVNFAHGAIATLAAYVGWQILRDGHNPVVAFLAAAAIGGVLAVVVSVLLARYLPRAAELTTAMATFGPALAFIGLAGYVWGESPQPLSEPGALGGAVSVLGATVGKFELVALCVSLAVVAMLSLLLRGTSMGLALRACADDPATASLNGINVSRLQSMVWAFAGMTAGVAGLTISMAAQLDPNFLTGFLIEAFTAVVLGGIGTLGGVVLGSLLYGIVVAGVSFYLGTEYVPAVSLGVLAIVYLVRPTGLLGGERLATTNRVSIEAGTNLKLSRALVRSGWTVRGMGAARLTVGRPGLIAVAAVLLAGLVLVPRLMPTAWIFVGASALAMTIAVSGQKFLSGLSGRLAVAQGGFMLVGGFVAANLALHSGLPALLAIVAAVPVGVLLGAALGLSILRISGLYLAIMTLQFTLAVTELARSWTGVTGGEVGLILPPVSLAGRSLIEPYDLWLLSLACAAVALGVLVVIARSSLGIRVRAARDSNDGASALGYDTRLLAVVAVAISAGAGAFAGALSAFQVGVVTPESFTLWTSVYVLLAATVAGQDSLAVGPVLGAALVVVLPFALASAGGLSAVIFGTAIILALVLRESLARARNLEAHDEEVALDDDKLVIA